MKLRTNIVSWIVSVGALCAVFAATVTVAAPCRLYFYEPKAPKNLATRLNNMRQ